MFAIKKKKKIDSPDGMDIGNLKENKITKDNKKNVSLVILYINALMFGVVAIYLLIKFSLFYFDHNKEIVKHEVSKAGLETLTNMRMEVDQLTANDKSVIEGDLKFGGKKFNKEIMDIDIISINLLDKAGKRSAIFSLVKAEFKIKAKSEKDLKKFMILMNMNNNIHKVESIVKDKDDNILIIIYYKINKIKKEDR